MDTNSQIVVILVSALLSRADAYLTLFLINSGMATEANPVLNYVMHETGLNVVSSTFLIDMFIYPTLIMLTPLSDRAMYFLGGVISVQIMIVASQLLVIF